MVPGELDPASYDDISAEIHRQLGMSGVLEVGGRVISWSNPLGRSVRVSIVAREGRSLIRVDERLGELGGGLFLGMGLPLAFAGLGLIIPICIVVLAAPLLILPCFLAWVALSFGLARTIFNNVARQRDPQLQALADGLAEICRGPSPGPTAD